MSTHSPGDPGEIEAALAQIAKRRPDLNTADDQYLALIARAEEALRALAIGLRFSTRMSFVETRNSVSETILSFDTHAGAWRLCVEEGPDDMPEMWDQRPLASADRETRFSVFRDGHLHRLIIEGLALLDREIATRDQCMPASTTLITTLEGAKPKKGGKP